MVLWDPHRPYRPTDQVRVGVEKPAYGLGSPNSLSQRTLVMIIVETVTRLLYGT